jgi:hypothetical protein
MQNKLFVKFIKSEFNLPTRNLTKRSIVGGDLNLSQANWKGGAEKANGFQACVNNLVWDNGYTQVVSGPKKGDALLDIYLLRHECSLISCNILPGISDHNGVLLEVEWDGICRETKVESIVPVYHKIDVLGLQEFLLEKFRLWGGNGSCVEDIWKSYTDIIFESIKRYVPQKFLSKYSDPEYYNKEIKRLKVKVRKMYNKRKFGQLYRRELKRLSKELLVVKKKAPGTFLRSVLQNEGRCWTEFYKYVKRRKGNRENIRAIKDHNSKLITDPLEKIDCLNSYYASLFSCKSNNPEVPPAQPGKPFTININITRKRLSSIGRKKFVEPDGIPGEILKSGGEAMIPYIARLLDVTVNNTIPGDWKNAVVVSIYKGEDRSVVGNYRPVSLTSVVCKQMEHVIAGYLRQVWEMSGWLYESQHGFRPGNSCESQVVTLCQDMADSLDEEVKTGAIIIDFSKAFHLVPHDRLLTKIAATGLDLRVVVWVKESLRTYAES